MDINYEAILSTDDKEIVRRHDSLRNNYTTESAEAYYEFYQDKPLSFILRNSRYIFSEPSKGLPFYESVLTNHLIPLKEYPIQLGKLNCYIQENCNKMDPVLKSRYDDAKLNLEILMMRNRNAINIAEKYADAEDMKDIYAQYDALYEGTRSDVIFEHDMATFADDLNVRLNDGVPTDVKELIDSYVDKSDDLSRVRMGNVMGRIIQDPSFEERINNLPSENLRYDIRECAAWDNEVFEANDNVTVEDVSIGTPFDVIDSMYETAVMEDILSENNAKIKVENLQHRYEAKAIEAEFLYMDYIKESEDNSSEDLTSESQTAAYYREKLTDVLLECQNLEEEIEECKAVMEETSIKNTRVNSGEAPKSISDRYDTGDVKKPTNRGLANKIQNKAIDADVKMKKKTAVAKQKFQGVKNAVKAVTSVPSNITNSIKNQIKEWDDMDDQKRKEYMAKPGSRKVWFKTLKAAIAHGIAFKISPICNIILAGGQYLSAQKNKRIRVDLVNELDSEINVTEEKIQDAQSRGDTEAKYRLIRIRDKLKQEKARVFTNSKVV